MLPQPSLTIKSLIKQKTTMGEPSPSALRKAQQRAQQKSQNLALTPTIPIESSTFALEHVPEEDTSEPVNALTIVDGQIVFTDLAPAPKKPRLDPSLDSFDSIDLPDYEEPHINSSSFGKSKSKLRWNAAEEDLFLKGLRLFKTNFTLMGTLIPTKTRRELTTKFNFEMKKRPNIILESLKYNPTEEDQQDYIELLEFSKKVGWQGIASSAPKHIDLELDEERYHKPCISNQKESSQNEENENSSEDEQDEEIERPNNVDSDYEQEYD
ncbi:hypothetical protein RCL1_001786 [Eukaryota sp. TZLM3-RCL]